MWTVRGGIVLPCKYTRYNEDVRNKEIVRNEIFDSDFNLFLDMRNIKSGMP